MISLEKCNIFTPLQNLPKNVGDLGKLIVAKGFKKLTKSNKSPNLDSKVTFESIKHASSFLCFSILGKIFCCVQLWLIKSFFINEIH